MFVRKTPAYNVDEIDGRTGVNFINVLQATFTRSDLTSTKRPSYPEFQKVSKYAFELALLSKFGKWTNSN
jgi:hypothetical protein